MDIAAWLRGLGLEQYAQVFRDNAIDPGVLPDLTDEHLKELGMRLGHRLKLLKAVSALRAGAADETIPESPPALPLAETEGERRPVTVLFADLAGYTALSNALDAEEVHALLGRFFERVDRIVEDHGGRVDKHIGDCVMAVFGAPVAHGNDAERALRAALAIRDAMPELSSDIGRPMRVHIGIAGGQVVASGTGSASHREYTVTGDSVNLAARLADAAAPGETLISEPVRRALAERLDCVEAGALTVKGFTEAVPAWRLRSLRETTSDRRPFVGRRGEQHQFRAALAACRETGRGQTIYLRGEAGIGKTRLIEEFRRAAGEAGFACHTGLVLDFGTGTGRDAIRALVRSLLGLDVGSPPEAVRAAAAEAFAETLVAADHAVFLNDLLDLPQPTELRALYDAMDQPMRDRGKRETIATLVRRLSVRRPLMLTIEDLHWADAMTLAQAAELAATVADCRTVLVVTSRVEGDPLDHAWRAAMRGGALTTIDLGPLRTEEALALAGAFVEADERFALACAERSGGHPLFLEQLLRSAEEIGLTSLPASIQSVVLARMDALDPNEKRALQAASVLGQRFALDTLRHLLGDRRYDCRGLVEHHLVRPDGEAFLFAHALIQQGVYASLLTARQRALHRRAAGWFAERDPVLFAEHLDRASDPEAPRAYLAAARAQAAAYRNEHALRLAERGLALASDRADIYALTCLRGELLHDLGAIPEAVAAYERALAAARDDVERCRAWIGLASGMRVVDRYDEAFSALETAETVAKKDGLAAELAWIHHLRGNLCFPLGDLEGCLREHERALSWARRAGSAELEARTLGGLGDAEYARGRMVTAHGHFHRCVELARAQGLGRVEVANLPMTMGCRVFFDSLPKVCEDCGAALEAAKRVGHQRAELIAQATLYRVLLQMGEGARAKPLIEQTRILVQRLGARRFEAHIDLYLAEACRLDGCRSEAASHLRKALAISRETGFGYLGPAILGALALASDDPQERRRALEEGERALAAGAVSHNHFQFYESAIEMALQIGDWDGVERYAAALETHTRPEPLPWTDFFIARGRTLAAIGRGRREAALMAEIRRLREEGTHLGLKPALTAINAALATAAPG